MSLGECSNCGTPLVLYFYPRPGPAPGNMRVCPKEECEGSVESFKRRQAEQFRKLNAGRVAGEEGN